MSRRLDTSKRLRESADVKGAFIKEGFSKYYLLALTNDMFERMTGYKLEEGEYRIGDEVGVFVDPDDDATIIGSIVGFAIAKAAYTAELADVNLDFLNIVETSEGIRFGEIIGVESDFYPISIQDVKDIVG